MRKVRGRPDLARAAVLVPLGLLALLVAGTSSAVELRDAELMAGAARTLQNGTGTVRLEDARLGSLSPPIFVPEPGFLVQLAPGIGLLALLDRRRRRRTASNDSRHGHAHAHAEAADAEAAVEAKRRLTS